MSLLSPVSSTNSIVVWWKCLTQSPPGPPLSPEWSLPELVHVQYPSPPTVGVDKLGPPLSGKITSGGCYSRSYFWYQSDWSTPVPLQTPEESFTCTLWTLWPCCIVMAPINWCQYEWDISHCMICNICLAASSFPSSQAFSTQCQRCWYISFCPCSR